MIDEHEAQLAQRRSETESYFRRAEWRMMLIFIALMVLNSFTQWLMGQLPDLSSEALQVVCRVLYQ